MVRTSLRLARRLGLVVCAAGSLASASQASAATLTVCPSCTYETIQAAVNAAQAGDTVDVKASGSPYNEQVNVPKQITLQGDPSGPAPTLQFAPSASAQPTLKFTNAASGSVLRHLHVISNNTSSNYAIDFEQSGGSITDVMATAAGSDGTGAAISGATVTDSTFTGGPGGTGLDLTAPATARRVKASAGAVGISLTGGALVTDSLAVASDAKGVAVEGQVAPGTEKVENVTAIASGQGGIGIEALQGESSTGSTMSVLNTVARGDPKGYDDVVGQINANDPNCYYATCTYGSVTISYSNFVNLNGNVDESGGHFQSGNPKFVDPAHGNYHLQAGSPLIGAGMKDTNTGSTDLDGKPRPAPHEAHPSIGAYEPATYLLAVKRAGSGGVTGPYISCPTHCSTRFVIGTTVTLVAHPATGWRFTGWSGSCTGTGECRVGMTASRAATARFVRKT